MNSRVKNQTGDAAGTSHNGPPHMVFLGTGYLARMLIPHLKKRGFIMTGTARGASAADRLRDALDINIVQFGAAPHRDFGPSLSPGLKKALASADYILSSIAPGSGTPPPYDDPVIGASGGGWASLAPHCRWAGYLSATSVYGDRAGQWAFEEELLRPGAARGRARIKAELAWLESGLPAHIFRLAGIYGPDANKSGGDNSSGARPGPSRNPLTRLRRGRRPIEKPGHVVNRIYADDVASAILASMNRPDPIRVYNIADGAPAASLDVMNFAATLLARPRPKPINYDNAKLSEMARSFYAECKRVDNSRARRELGWKPAFPDYKHGLLEIWRREMDYPPSAICLAGELRFDEALSDDVKKALSGHSELSRAEPGCLYFDVRLDSEDGSILHVTEAFDDRASFAAHQARMIGTDWARLSAGAVRNYVTIGPL